MSDVVPRLINFAEMRELGMLLSKRHVDRLERRGEFPRRVPLSARRIAWVRSEIIDYLEQKAGERSMLPGVLGSFKKAG